MLFVIHYFEELTKSFNATIYDIYVYFLFFRQAELRLQRKRAHQVEIEEFRKQQQLWRQQEEKRIRQENEHIIAEMAEQESRVDVISKDRKQRQAQLEAIQVGRRKWIRVFGCDGWENEKSEME